MKHTSLYMVNLICTCLLMVCFIAFSCKKAVSVDLPIDKLTADAVFETEDGATSAVVGIYTQMMPTLPYYSSGGTSMYVGLMADELLLTNTTLPEETEFEQSKVSPANPVVQSNFWQWAYKLIYQSNACIEGITASPSIPTSVKAKLLGEAKLIRAFHYFYLVNIFGDVPLVLTTDYRTNATAVRTPVARIYKQLVVDLKEAKENLSVTYSGTGRTRPNKWAAAALLARVYLYQGEWAAAEAISSEIISSGLYSLTALANAFVAGSNEAIWQLLPVETGFNTTEARYFVPTSTATTKPMYVLTSGLVNAFTAGDARKAAWVGSKTVSVQIFSYPFKYKVRNLNLPVTENYSVFRYAEVLLIRAEARAQLDNLTGAKADLDLVRTRAGLPGISASSKTALLTAIENERRVEFFAEWGHRWFDLKRWGRLQAVMSAAKPAWEPSAALFPIPQTELLKAPGLTQNPGY